MLVPNVFVVCFWQGSSTDTSTDTSTNTSTVMAKRKDWRKREARRQTKGETRDKRRQAALTKNESEGTAVAPGARRGKKETAKERRERREDETDETAKERDDRRHTTRWERKLMARMAEWQPGEGAADETEPNITSEADFWKTTGMGEVKEHIEMKSVADPVPSRKKLMHLYETSCACCGTRIRGPEVTKHTTDEATIVTLFGTKEEPSIASERGINGTTLIKKLIHEDGKTFSVCEICKNSIGSCTKHMSWRKDFGDISSLPRLTAVEKACIAKVRLYGKLVKIRNDVGGEAPKNLIGHLISFPQDPSPVTDVLPHRDPHETFRVHFLGGKTAWSEMMPLIAGRGGALEFRGYAVEAWLQFLKANNPLYKDIRIDMSEEAVAAVNASIGRILAEAITEEDESAAHVDAAVASNVAEQAPIGISEVCVEVQDPKLDERAAFKAYRNALGIPTVGTEPINEFDNLEVLLCSAFPWVFALGKIMPEFRRMDNPMRELILLHHDDRVEDEQSLLFLLFNMMQRHRATHNIARARPDQKKKIDELSAMPQRVFDDAFDEKKQPTTEEGKRARKMATEALHIGTSSVPFSRGEMDRAWIEMVAMLRWFGCPLVFLTISPSMIDNFGKPFFNKKFEERASLAMRSPISSALFYRAVLDEVLYEICKAPRGHNTEGLGPGVFGKVRAYAMTTETQGRTLLHAHILLWCDVSPEYAEQLFAKRMEEKLAELYKFVDECAFNDLPKDFWEMSDAAWKDKVRLDPPGLEEEKPEDQRMDLKQRTYHLAHLYQLHRLHKATCWKKCVGSADRAFCRMGMPKRPWPQPTQMIVVKRDYVQEGPNKGTEVLRPFTYDQMEFEWNRCTHAFGCMRKPEKGSEWLKPNPGVALIETKRSIKDEVTVCWTPAIGDVVRSNTSTVIIPSLTDAATFIMYLIKYTVKNKMLIANCLPSLIAAQKKIQEADVRGTKVGPNTFWEKFVNSATAMQEVPATSAVYGLLGNHGYEANWGKWCVFPWDAIGEDEVRNIRSGKYLKEDGLQENDPNEEIYLGRADEEVLDDPADVTESTGRIFTGKNGKKHVIRQEEFYANRPDALENMSFLAFSMLYDIEDMPKEKKKERAERAYFKEGFVLAETHRLKARPRPLIPILAGANPPRLPQNMKTKPSAVARQVWGTYWTCLLLPWRKKSDFLVTDAEDVLRWLGRALRSELSEMDHIRARFVCNCTFSFEKDDENAGIGNKWKNGHADEAEYDKGKWKVKNTGQVIEDGDLTLKMQEIAILAEIAQLGNGEAQDKATHRKAQLENLLPSRGPAERSQVNTALPLDLVKTGELYKEMASHTEDFAPEEQREGNDTGSGAVAMDGGYVETAAGHKDLNEDQNKVFKAVLDAASAKRQELIFIQGEAGTGKSYTINKIVSELRKLYGKGCVRMLSPTGAAADNLGLGTLTIHRGMNISVATKSAQVEELKTEGLFKLVELFRGCFVVIIDEVSMVSPNLLGHINQRLRTLAESLRRLNPRLNPNVDFGGFIVVCAGDFRQIPPVGSRSLLQEALYPQEKKSSNGYLWRKFRKFELKQQMRAREPVQEQRVKILQSGKITDELIDSIKVLSKNEAEDWTDATFLVQTNADRQTINEELVRRYAVKTGQPIVKWRNGMRGAAKTKLPKAASEKMYAGIPALTSTFVEGAQAMITENVNPALGLANGSSVLMRRLCGLRDGDAQRIADAAPGEVVWIEPPDYILVENDAAHRLQHLPFVFRDGPHRMFPLRESLDEVTFGSSGTQKVSYFHHPVDIAFAITIHKAQGKTLQRAVLCVDPGAKFKLTFEMFLVGATRVRNGDDLRFLSPAEFGKNFSFLKGLKPNKYTEEWFFGLDRTKPPPFDRDGYRHYQAETPLPRGEVKKKPAGKRSGGKRVAKSKEEEKKAEKKAKEDDAEIEYMLALQEEADEPKGKKARVEAENEEDDPRIEAENEDDAEIEYMLRIQQEEAVRERSHRQKPERQQDELGPFEREFLQMQRFGQLMPSDAIDQTLAVAGACGPRFITGAAWSVSRWPSPPQGEFCSWMFHNAHFVFLIINPQNGAVRFMDSLDSYSVQTREEEIAVIVSILAGWYPGIEFSVSQVPCRQQATGSNDCAMYVTNNALEWLGIPMRVDRTMMADAWLGQFQQDN